MYLSSSVLSFKSRDLHMPGKLSTTEVYQSWFTVVFLLLFWVFLNFIVKFYVCVCVRMCLCEYLYMCVCMCMHQFLLRDQKMVLGVLCLSQGSSVYHSLPTVSL